jgi:hypothetical protein
MLYVAFVKKLYDVAIAMFMQNEIVTHATATNSVCYIWMFMVHKQAINQKGKITWSHKVMC